ncbi:hypothetical protein D4764_08G0002030 [Takifugu flavidus]|uniref:Uncharacterized protein n=1 Tax=Takifugu flavidus TaxID=433684 RepID=A0A5C6MM37_9TELE|nr:hypothetical protein D4764_08G0002030 [Takifugu flavidus]
MEKLSQKAKLLIYRSIFVPTLTYGHELWVMTERTRSRVQAAEMSFLRRVAGLSLRDRVRSSAIREELGVKLLLLRVERSQMRWLGHLVRMSPGRLPGEVFRACPCGRKPPGRPRTRWRDDVSRLVWEHLGIPPGELEEVAEEREVWVSFLRLLPLRPDPGLQRGGAPSLPSRSAHKLVLLLDSHLGYFLALPMCFFGLKISGSLTCAHTQLTCAHSSLNQLASHYPWHPTLTCHLPHFT